MYGLLLTLVQGKAPNDLALIELTHSLEFDWSVNSQHVYQIHNQPGPQILHVVLLDGVTLNTMKVV